MRDEKNIYREEDPTPNVIITEETWHQEESPQHTLVVSNQEPHVEKKQLFADSFKILMMSRNPQGRSINKVYEEQLQQFVQQVMKLSLNINEQLIELGMLIIEGEKIGLHRLAGFDTMIEWVTLGLHLSLQIVSIATDRYQVWRFASRFNLGLDDLANIEAAQLKILQHMRINVDRQAKHIARRKAIDCIAEQDDENLPENIEDMSFEEVMRLVPEEIRPQVRAEAEEEYRAWMAGEIRHVLDSDPAELRNNDTRNGEVVKPTFPMKIKFDPSTGRLEGRFVTYVENEHLLAMQKGQYNLRCTIESPLNEDTPQGSMNVQDLGHYLESISDSSHSPY